MKKRLISCLMACIMVFSLSACGQVTVDDLQSEIDKLDSSKYSQYYMSIDMTLDTDYGDIGLWMDSDVESCGNIVHMYNTEMTVKEFGETFYADMEAWSSSSDAYANASVWGEESGWIHTPGDVSQINGMTSLMENINRNATYTMDENERGKGYVLTRTLSSGELSEMNDFLEAIIGEDVSELGSFSYSDISVKLIFHKETLELKRAILYGSGNNDFSIKVDVQYTKLNGDETLQIPTNVIARSTDA